MTLTRRRLLAAAGAAPLVAAPPPAPSAIETWVQRLNLRHTWTTVMSSSQYRDTFFVNWRRDGITGTGEGAPIVRYNESATAAVEVLQPVTAWLKQQDPAQFVRITRELDARIPGHYAMKAAVDIALLDWNAQRLGVPLYRMFGLDPKEAPVTVFSIGIDKREVIQQKVREAEPFPVLKIKVGLDNDEEVLDAVRSVTKKPLRADANEGFKSKEDAVRKINWLEKLGVEFIEQPLPAANLEDMNWIRKRVHLPVVADEACLRPADVAKVAPYFDGVNVKVDKAGGLQPARRMIETARSFHLKVMLGCMVSSSAAITAAATLSPLVDYADLDGPLLISNDPYEGVEIVKGQLVLPNRPGLGLRPRKG